MDSTPIEGGRSRQTTQRSELAGWTYGKWNFLADKANLEPRIPPTLSRAAEVVRSHAPPSMTQDQIDRAIDTLHAPYSRRTIRTFRAAMKSLKDPTDQAQKILEIIRDLGLEPYVPPKPLPEITQDEVHLVCWLALIPERLVS